MLTREEANKIEVTDTTEVSYINGEWIHAEKLQKWAYRRLETWPALLKSCQALLEIYLNQGCRCQRCTDISIKAKQAIRQAETN